MTVFRCQPLCLSGGYLFSLSSSFAVSGHLCFSYYISGVKRGVCSQINHFPEDADFDHDGAEYVLRKSILALLCVNDYMHESLDKPVKIIK